MWDLTVQILPETPVRLTSLSSLHLGLLDQQVSSSFDQLSSQQLSSQSQVHQPQ